MGKRSGPQRETFSCPPDFLQKTFQLDLSQDILCQFLFLCPSGRGGEFLSGRERSGREGNEGDIRKPDTNATIRGDREKRREKKKKKAEGEIKSEVRASMHRFGRTKNKSGVRETRKRLALPRRPWGRRGWRGEGKAGAQSGVIPVIPALRVIPQAHPARGARDSTRNLAVHLPICTARSREI